MHGDIETVLSRLRSPASGPVIVVGRLPAAIYDEGWPARVTDDVVITKERRGHYVDRHGTELILDTHERVLLQAVVDPHEVHRNVIDPQMAIIYQSLSGDDSHVLRIALWISHDDSGRLKNSVHSIRLARMKEVLVGRERGRKVWP